MTEETKTRRSHTRLWIEAAIGVVLSGGGYCSGLVRAQPAVRELGSAQDDCHVGRRSPAAGSS